MNTDYTASMVAQRRADLHRQAAASRLEKAARSAKTRSRTVPPTHQTPAPRRAWGLAALFGRAHPTVPRATTA